MLKHLLILLLLSACAGNVSKVLIKTSPDKADVYVRNVGSNTFKKIGQTPFDMKLAQMRREANADKGPLIVEIRKDGHITQRTIVTDLGYADMEMFAQMEVDKDLEIVEKVDEISVHLFEAQRLIRATRYDDALKILRDIEKIYPYMSVIHELQGGVYYLQKDYRKAFDAFDTAFKYNSKNIDAYKMKAFLEKTLNISRPLSPNGSKREPSNAKEAN